MSFSSSSSFFFSQMRDNKMKESVEGGGGARCENESVLVEKKVWIRPGGVLSVSAVCLSTKESRRGEEKKNAHLTMLNRLCL